MYKKKLLNKFKRKGIIEIVNNGNNTNLSFYGIPYRWMKRQNWRIKGGGRAKL